ncbi:MAG: CDP-alcohol phosphatidyltransferase family protein [Candidatus Bipolaricaulota bacterium]|nr:CDP-alcohol phosphatidyltransferase family protein [Candidatus Bipolaricaulota bacterium]
MSVANKITLARGALIPPILILLAIDQRWVAVALFIVACAGDIVDGMVARARDEVSEEGEILDPLIDKALYLSLFIAFTVRGEITLTPLILFLIPQAGLLIGGTVLHFRSHIVQGARVPGKIAAVLVFASMVLLMLHSSYRLTLLYVAIGVSYLAALDYLWVAVRARLSRGMDSRETRVE